MVRYTDKNHTPLAYHTFFRYVALPLGILTTLGSIFEELRYFDEFGLQPGSALYAITAIELLFYLVDLALLLVSFIGFFHWSRYAWYATMIRLFLSAAYQIYSIFIYAIYVPSEISIAISHLIGALILGILLGIYYWKRKALFFPTPPEPEAACPVPPLSNDPPRAAFCRICGQRLPSDGDFCPQCGTPVRRETPPFQ